MPSGAGGKAPAAPKTLADKVVAAVAALAQPGGASRQAIKKHVETALATPIKSPALLAKALDAAVKKGLLEQNGQRWSQPGVVIEVPEDQRVHKKVLKDGSGPAAAAGDTCVIDYVGTLRDFDRSEFDRSKGFRFTLGAGEVIKGWEQGVAGMRVGERAELTCPPALAYGKRGSPPEIPGEAWLVFELTLVRVV